MIAALAVSAMLILALSLPAMAQSKKVTVRGAGTVEDPIVWRMGGLYPRDLSYGRTYEAFADSIKRLSGGRMVIEVIHDYEGIHAQDILSALRIGQIEMANPFMALHAGEFPAGGVDLGLPDGPSDLLEVRAMYREGGWMELVRRAYESVNARYLSEAIYPGIYLMTKKPVNSLADLKNMKIRCPGVYGEKLKNLGAIPITMPLGEVYSGLTSGLIDGVSGCAILDHYEIKSYKVAGYLYKLPVADYQSCGLMANLDAYNALPDDLKAVVEAAAELFGNDQSNKTVIWEREALQAMMKDGLQYSPSPSREDTRLWKEAGRKVWTQYAEKDQYCKDLIEAEINFMKQLGYTF